MKTDSVKVLQRQVQSLEKEVKRKDGWINTLSGIGGKADKRKYNKADAAVILTDEELESLYFGEGFATTIVDTVADDMTREWIEIESNSEDEKSEAIAEKIKDELDKIEVQQIFNEAIKWQRLYGGSIIIIGATDGNDIENPLGTNIKSIAGLRVVDRTDIDLAQSEFVTDVNSPRFGSVEKFHVRFSVNGVFADKKVHASRCIVLKGKKIPSGADNLFDSDKRFWGLSIIQVVNDKLSDFGGITSAVVNMMHEFSVGKYTIKGLAQKMAAGKEADIVNRMTIIGMMKSVINSVLMDEGEQYSRDSVSLGSVPEILDRFMMFLSGVAQIPVTKLFGRSAAGMNATGEGDLNNYYDTVRAQQQTALRPAINQLITVIQKYLKTNETVKIEFNPLMQKNEKEEAEIEKLEAETEQIKANTYSILVQAQILDPLEVYEVEYSEKFAQAPSPAGEVDDE